MEILFVGCSITWGDELQDRLKDRYSRLVCDALGANETNIAECGQSNDWIARKTVEAVRAKQYDRVYVQLTIPCRMEYFVKDGSFNFTPQAALMPHKPYKNEMRAYYKYIKNDSHDIENMYKNKFIIESAVKSDLIFLGADCCMPNLPPQMYMHDRSAWNQFCDVNPIWIWRDILGHAFKQGPNGKKESHPLEDSHKKIADYLLNSTKYTKIV